MCIRDRCLDTEVNIHTRRTTDFALASRSFTAAGVHMTGPNDIADQGGTRTLYRIIANGYCESDNWYIALGFARSPTSPSDATDGNSPSKEAYLAGGTQHLQFDDIIAVDPFPDADAAKAICFYIYFHNHSSASHSTRFSFNLSVARLVGARPMMHDQRIQ